MFARVIPLLRTPFGVEAFDYRIPDGMGVAAGDLVMVPFRKRMQPALVEYVLKSSPYSNKALSMSGTYAGIRFGPLLPLLVRSTAQRTFTSAPTVAAAWLRELPKRPGELPLLAARSNGKGSMKSFWSPDSQQAFLDRAQAARRESRVLLLTPWKHRAERFGAELDAPLLTSDLAGGAAFKAWHEFLSARAGILVATKIGAWMAPLCDLVLIDEPENDDHKQDDLAPRYDIRRMAAWASSRGANVEAYGLTPPLHVNDAAPAIGLPLEVHPRTRAGRSAIPMIEASSLERLRLHDGPRIIVHPVRGEASKFACQDCGWTAGCPHCGFPLSPTKTGATCRRCRRSVDPPLACESCGSPDLGKAMPGIDKLKRQAASREGGLAIEWRETVPSDLERPMPERAMVLVTDAGLLAAGGTEDVRRNERKAIAFRRLAAAVNRAEGSLLIQCSEASYGEWADYLTSEGFARFRKRELDERKAFGYPPATRLAKIILPEGKMPGELPGLRGPFPVAHRPRSRSARNIWHWPIPADMRDEALFDALTPLADQGAIIDLDPIAFFR